MFAGRHFLSFGFTSLGHRQVTECSAYHEESIMTEDRYYAVRMLWVRDDEIWQSYQEMAKPVLARHDVRVEHWLETDKIVGEGMDKPDLIVVTSYPSRAALEAFESDPDFKKASMLRDTSAKLLTVTARSGLP
ncbi:MAG: hypothetical protein DRH23_06235 [Deltaproteobacteria bacterium]|nr:MAG: hypothetical protein DRH23_06235 [Deltaproteobacteria bacterium]